MDQPIGQAGAGRTDGVRLRAGGKEAGASGQGGDNRVSDVHGNYL
jgi:hypothetical protein